MNGYNVFHPELYKCTWYLIDNSHRLLLGVLYFIFGIVSTILNIWLLTTFLQSALLHKSRRYLLFLNLSIASIGRQALGGFVFSGISALVGRWIFGEKCCQFFGFLRQFFNVWLIIALLVLAIERYRLSRSKYRGVRFKFAFYTQAIVFCIIYSLIFSLPPLFQIGSYKCDLTGIACELDWSMLKRNQIVFNWMVIIFCGIVPVFTTIYCLNFANSKYALEKQTYSRKIFTKISTLITALLYLFWLPQAAAILLIITGLAWAPRVFPVPLVLVSSICAEVCGLIPVICYMTKDERIRMALMGTITASVKKSREIFR